MQPIGFVCKCGSYYEAYFLFSRWAQRKAATRMRRDSSNRLGLNQPEALVLLGIKPGQRPEEGPVTDADASAQEI